MNFGGAVGVIVRQIARDRDQLHAVFTGHGAEARARLDGHDICQRDIDTAGGPHLGTVEEVCRQLTCGQFDTDCGGAWAVRVGRGLDPAKAVSQNAAQAVDGEPERLTLRGQFKDQLFLVVGQRVLNGRDFTKLRQFGFEGLCGGLQDFGIGAKELDVDVIATGTGGPGSEADGFHHRMTDHAVLQFSHEGEAGIRAAVGVYQLDGNGTKLVRILRVRACNATARIAADFRDHVVQWIDAKAFLILRAEGICDLLQGLHHLKRIFAGGTRQHGKVAGDAALFGGVKEPPLDVTADKRRGLDREQHDRQRHDRIARPDHTRHEGTEEVLFDPVKPAVHEPARRVVPAVFAGVRQGLVHVVGQDQEAFDQRRDKYHDHGERNVGDQVPEPSAHQHQREEGDDRGQRGRKNGAEHLFGGVFGGLCGAFT